MYPPKPTKPLTSDVTDMDVIEGRGEAPKLLFETEEARLVLSIFQDYDKKEEFTRSRLVRIYRKQLHYWNSYQYLAWDAVGSSWKTPEDIIAENPTADIDPAIYAKVVNVYKAHGEILIGALSAGTPTVRFFPKDADAQEDVITAKGRTKLSELISKQNRARLLLMKALFILYNQSFVACYNENKEDFKFGSIKEPKYDDVPITHKKDYCASCGHDLGSQIVDGHIGDDGAESSGAIAGDMDANGLSFGSGFGAEDVGAEQQLEQGPPGSLSGSVVGSTPQPQFGEDRGASLDYAGLSTLQPQQMPQMPQMQAPIEEPQQCPNCGAVSPPESEFTHSTEQRQVGENQKPKARECLEVYGPLNVKIPAWVHEQSSTPYLNLETEEHVALIREIYPELASRIVSSSYPDTFEKEARIPSHYRTDFPSDIVTVSRVWFRPWAANLFMRESANEVTKLKEKYPDGFYVVIINKELIAEIVPDRLDDHWTISENPMSEVLHSNPIGAPMVPLQDITNELTNLTLETVEFGLPEIFADPGVVDFESYNRQEARPGQVSPAVAPSGQNLSAGFHEIKAASLSREVEPFAERIQNSAQFVMGSYPSIYGGAQDGGSGTAREYELSKASALQRISTTWTIIQEWWCRVMTKATKSFAINMQEDESYSTAKGTNFIKVWIRQSEFNGEVGDAEPEISETFPVSWTQKRDVMLNLMTMNNEDISAVIRHPENAGLVATMIGVPELYIPGDDDRSKQLAEIAELILMEPMEVPPTNENRSGMLSSVPVDPDVDNHAVEAEVCKAWMKSEVGMDCKKTNPAGYANVLAHLKEHIMYVQSAAVAGAEAGSEDSGGESKDKGQMSSDMS